MIKKKPAVKKKVVKTVKKMAKKAVKPVKRTASLLLPIDEAYFTKWLLDNLPPDVEMIMKIPNSYEDGGMYMFVKGKSFSVRELQPHPFQPYTTTVEQKTCSLCLINIPPDPEVRYERGDPRWIHGTGLMRDGWLERLNCPVFEAKGFRNALEILERF